VITIRFVNNVKEQKIYTGSGPDNDPVKTLHPVVVIYCRERVRCSDIAMMVAQLSRYPERMVDSG
jgi:hypothetical protein